jgi:hypothetical protein
MERMRKIRIFQPSGYLSLNLADGTGEFLRLKRDLPFFAEGQEWDVESDADLSRIVDRVVLQGRDEEPLAMELVNFRDAVAGQGTPAVSGEQGRSALEISLLIEERIEAHVVDTRTA